MIAKAFILLLYHCYGSSALRNPGRDRINTVPFLFVWPIAALLLQLNVRAESPGTLRVPPGFKIAVYAADVPAARQIAVGSSGLVFVGSRQGKVYALVDKDGDYKVDETVVITDQLALPTGVALHDGALFVGDVSRILRFDNIAEHYRERPMPHVVYDRLPTDTHHGLKYLAFGPEGKLYVPVGAPCNVCLKPLPYSALLRLNPDGSGLEVVATGIRNSEGFAWHPVTSELWFTDNGRDWLGDNRPDCELNRVTAVGQHFGFPYVHGGDVFDPEFGVGHTAQEFTPPVVKLGPHVAPLGMMFYTGRQFPAQYRDNLFIAEHGSWNRTEKIGYRVVRVVLDKNGVAITHEPLITGWLHDGEVTGRPVDIAALSDGSVLISDDEAGVIYRLSYGG